MDSTSKTDKDRISNQQKLEKHGSTLMGLMSLADSLPEPAKSRVHGYVAEILAFDESERYVRLENLAHMNFVMEKADRYKLQSETFFDVLMKVIQICKRHGSVIPEIMPHLLTLQRFLDENKSYFSIDDARRKVAAEFNETSVQSRV